MSKSNKNISHRTDHKDKIKVESISSCMYFKYELDKRYKK